MPSDRRAIVLAAAVFTALSAAVLLATAPGDLGVTEFPLDDGWIHQVYVRSLVVDGRLAYNPGDPEAGFSSLLWVFVCAPLHFIARVGGLPIALGAKLCSIASGLLASVGIGRVALALGGDRRAALVAQALLALSWAAGFSAVSGMESSLALACGAWALAARFEERVAAAGLWLAFASLARPECAVLVGVLAVASLAETHTARARVRELAWLTAPTALALVLWACVNFSLVGHCLPTTFYVKVRGFSLATNAAVFARDVLVGEGFAHVLVAAPLALVALASADDAHRSARRTTLACAALGVAAVALSRPLFEKVTFFQVRYFVPFSLLAVPLAGVGAAIAWTRARVAVRVVVAGVAALALAAGEAHLVGSHATHCAEIRALHTDVARDVARHAPRGAVVAAEAAGAMRFFGERQVVDLYGLNTAAVAFAADNRARTCAIVRDAPSVVAVPPWWEPRLRPAFELRPLRTYRVAEGAVVRDAGPRAVVLFAARVRPGVAARCGVAVYGERSAGEVPVGAARDAAVGSPAH